MRLLLLNILIIKLILILDSDDEIRNENIEFIESRRVHSLYNGNQMSLKPFVESNILYEDCIKDNTHDVSSIYINSEASALNNNATETIQKCRDAQDELQDELQNEENEDVIFNFDSSHLSQNTQNTVTYNTDYTNDQNIIKEEIRSPLINIEMINLTSATESQKDFYINIVRSQDSITENNTSFDINNTHSNYENLYSSNLYSNNMKHLNRRRSRYSITSKISKRKKYLAYKYFCPIRTPDAISNNASNSVFEERNNQAVDLSNTRCIPSILPYNGNNVINAIANGFNSVQTNSDRHAELCRQIEQNPNYYITTEEYRNFQGVEPSAHSVADQRKPEQDYRSHQIRSRNIEDTWQYQCNRSRLNERNECQLNYNSLRHKNFKPTPTLMYPYAHMNSFKQVPLNLMKDADVSIDYSRNNFNINMNSSQSFQQNWLSHNHTHAYDSNQAASTLNQSQDILFDNYGMAMSASNFHQNEFPQARVQNQTSYEEIFNRIDAKYARYRLQQTQHYNEQTSNNSYRLSSYRHETLIMPSNTLHDIRHSDRNIDNRLNNMQGISSRCGRYPRMIDNRHHSSAHASAFFTSLDYPRRRMRNATIERIYSDNQLECIPENMLWTTGSIFEGCPYT